MVYDVNARLSTLGTRMKAINVALVDLDRSGEGQIAGVSSSLGRTEAEEMIPGVAVTHVRYQDFFFDAVDYGVGWADALPNVGDTITIQAGQTMPAGTYRVISLGNDTPPYEYTTSTRERLRIHTDQIG